MIAMNLNSAASFGVPRGFPLRLFAAGDSVAVGVIPPWVASVTAMLATELGAANAHLALCTMPATAGGSDLAVVAQSDLVGLTTKTGQTIAVTVPVGALPCCYVVRLWVDGITSRGSDVIARDGGATPLANQPAIPVGVLVASVVVA